MIFFILMMFVTSSKNKTQKFSNLFSSRQGSVWIFPFPVSGHKVILKIWPPPPFSLFLRLTVSNVCSFKEVTRIRFSFRIFKQKFRLFSSFFSLVFFRKDPISKISFLLIIQKNQTAFNRSQCFCHILTLSGII